MIEVGRLNEELVETDCTMRCAVSGNLRHFILFR